MKEERRIIDAEFGERLLANVVAQRPLKKSGVEKIAASIADYGWDRYSAIGIVRGKNGVRVMAGHHRLNALKRLGWPNVVATIHWFEENERPDRFWMTDNMTIPQTLRDNVAMLEKFTTPSNVIVTINTIFKGFISEKKHTATGASEYETIAIREMLNEVFANECIFKKVRCNPSQLKAAVSVFAFLNPEKAGVAFDTQTALVSNLIGERNAAYYIRSFLEGAGAISKAYYGNRSTCTRLYIALENQANNRPMKKLTSYDMEWVRAKNEDIRIKLLPHFEKCLEEVKRKFAD